jgi:uncharacterized protein (DUF736 family)
MNDKEYGALWLRESKDGKKYMSGTVGFKGEQVQIVVFKNTYKDAENKPDYKIYLSKPKGEAKQEEFQSDIPF